MNVNVVGPAFSESVEFMRVVEVSLPFWVKPEGVDSLTGYAATWNVRVTGVHGSDAGYILSWVTRYTDKFIDEYLRVNADVCGRIAN